MTIKPGQDWGEPIERSPDLQIAASDRQLARLVTSGQPGPFTVVGGDLYRSLGSPRRRSEMRRVSIDMIDLVTDSGEYRAVANVALYRSLWRGEVVAVCNCSGIGSWDVAPKAHPNDGLLDVVEVSAEMSIRARWQARGRLATGTHLPHPDITSERFTQREWSFDRPLKCFVDGELVGETTSAAITVVPDAFALDY